MKTIEKLLPHGICTHCKRFKPVINEQNTVSRITSYPEYINGIELSCENLEICKNLITLVKTHHDAGETKQKLAKIASSFIEYI